MKALGIKRAATPTIIGRAVGFVCGLFLVIIGFSLLTPEAGLTQTAQTSALISVVVALGIGVTAGSLLPNAVTVHGAKLKPLGINLSASGGAAFFVLTLMFLFYAGNATQAAAPPPPVPAMVSAEPASDPAPTVAAAKPSRAPIPSPSPEPEIAHAEPTPLAEPSPDVANLPAQAQVQSFEAAPAPDKASVEPAASYAAWTYCSACCPEGPDACEQVGSGEAASFAEAAHLATQMCIANGGRTDTCYANVRQF